MKRVVRKASSAAIHVFHPVVPAEMKPHRVKQEFKKDVDINEIVSRMKRGIQPPPWLTSNTPRYGDYADMPVSFMEAYDMVARAEASFASLPLEFRRELDHDPRNLPNAPRELFERFGLIKPNAPEAAPAASGALAPEGVQGERRPPAKAPSGANKGIPAKESDSKSDKD